MPHAFRVYRLLKNQGFKDNEATAVASVVEMAIAELFDREQIADALCNEGLPVVQAEAFTDLLQNCFPSEKSQCWFDKNTLKRDLVRSGVSSQVAENILASFQSCIVTRSSAEVRVPIRLPLKPGQVVMCDFTFLRPPEMQKERRAIVLSTSRMKSGRRCTVVPVSMTEPRSATIPNHRFSAGSYNFFHRNNDVWAVCDHAYTLGYTRMWQININRRPCIPSISDLDLSNVRQQLGSELGICS